MASQTEADVLGQPGDTGNSPAGPVPDSTAPDSTAPDSTAPDSTAPDSTAPDNTETDNTGPDNTETTDAAPAGAGPTAATPGRAPSGGVANGYALVLPPGWRKLPVRHGTHEAIREILDEVVGRVGTGTDREQLIRARVELQGRLSAMAVRARDASGVDLYLPVEYVHGTPVPASFSVSEGAPGSPGGTGVGVAPAPPAESAQPLAPEELIAYLASADDATSLVTLDGAPGIRTDHVTAADPGTGAPLPSRQVDYVVTIPGSPDRWLMVVFSTVGDGDPAGRFANILVELFDAIMSTFRWTWPGQEPGQQPDPQPAQPGPRKAASD